jgi:putative transposase
MLSRTRLLIPNACYHIIARGNQKQKVFLDTEDYLKYLFSLRKYKKKFNIRFYGFCLMPNHIHIIVEPQTNPDLPKFMQSLSRAYTAHFNNRYNKVGHLWQNRYKSKVIVKDDYLIDCIHYVELNPVRAGIVRSAGEYCWSSYQERMGGKIAIVGLLDLLQL